MADPYGFQVSNVYRLAVGVARWMREVPWGEEHSHLRDQATVAADAVVLHIAESWSREGRACQRHLRITTGSTVEVLAILDLVDFQDASIRQRELRRLGAILSRLASR